MDIFHHNVLLQPMGDKVLIVTIVDKDAFGDIILPNQSFALGTTSTNIYSGMQPSIKLDITKLQDADEWCEKQTGRPARGMGISGLLTEPIWFCQRVKNLFEKLTG